MSGGGGGGGAGGFGLIITGSGTSSSNSATISGGVGGVGGAGDVGGNGGSGGGGVYFTLAATLTNSGAIAGGSGGSGGAELADVYAQYDDGGTLSNPGVAGGGGAGVTGDGITVIDGGSISGGLSGDGSTRADAIMFTGGANVLTLQSGWSLTGDIDVVGSVTFNQSSTVTLSNIITDTGAVKQNGTGTLDLAGSNIYTGGTTIESGKLEIASGASAGSGAITFAGTGILKIDAAANFTFSNTLAGLTASDTLDLAGLTAATTTATTGAGSYNSSTNLTTLTVHDTSGGGKTDTFDLSGNYSSSSWTVTSDGAGGVNVVDPAPTDPLSVPDGGTASIGAAAATAITFAGASGTLQLGASQSFTGTIAGFGAQDKIDLADLGFGANSTVGYAANNNNSGGMLTVSNGTTTANIALLGSADNFTMSSDGHGGTLITDSPAGQPATIAAGSTLLIGASSNESVTFSGATGSLVLNDPEGFSGTIDGFTGTAANAQSSDVIDLAGIDYNSHSFSEHYNSQTGVLTVSVGTDSASLTFVDFTGSFKFAADGNGGTDIYDPPAANSSNAAVTIGGHGDDHFVFHPEPWGDTGNAGAQAGNNAEHDHLAWAAHAQEWSTLIGGEPPSLVPSDDTHSHDAANWHLAAQNALHLH